MIDVIKIIISNILTALYQPFWYALIMAILCMFVYMFAKDCGVKVLLKAWVNNFKKKKTFRYLFFLCFYTIMILFRTLLNREMWANPISNVIGVWWIYDENGALTTEIFENLALFVPFTVLLLWCFREKIIGVSVKLWMTLWKSMSVVFLFSLSIEFLQLFLRLGTFQLSDLFYNTLGGVLGGLIYWCGYKIARRKKSEDEE